MHGRRRLWLLAALCAAVFALFALRLFWMQFVLRDHYAEKVAEASGASYIENTPAARGTVTDRDGVPLAWDETAFDLYLTYPAPPGTQAEETIQILQRCGALAPDGGEDVEAQLAAFALSVAAGELPLAKGLDRDTVAALYAAGLPQKGAVRLAARGVRAWGQNGALAPHILGFTGPVTAEQWQADDYALSKAGIAMDADIGQAGLEAAYDALLRPVTGTRSVRVDVKSGAVVGGRTLRAPGPGTTLELCLDAELQGTVQRALAGHIQTLQTTKGPGAGKEARAGAAVVVDVKDGGILAAVSWPGYDLTNYRQNYAALLAAPGAPLFARVTQGQYAPGSAFKPAVAAAALAAGLITPEDTVWCGGRYTFYRGYQPHCLQIGHRGAVDLYTALKYSCNIFFYDVGRRLGVDAFSAAAQTLGLGADPGAELPGAAGRLTWSDDANYQNGLELQAAIGQGNTAVTPLQLAAYAAALAGGGTRPALHFAKAAYDAVTGEPLWEYTPTTAATAPGGAEVFGPIRQGMTAMAGTMAVLRGAPVSCAAKTGSPQLPETLPGGSHYTNSVLIAYAPAEAPQIAVAVVIEYGGGGANAAPVLRAILDAAPLWADD